MKREQLKLLFALALLAALSGCSRPSIPELQAKLERWMQQFTLRVREETQEARAQSLLAAGIGQYEEGEYADAATSLHAALNLGLPPRDEVKAHKHLAFLYCAADLEPACRSEFRRALAVDPALELDAAEAGHPAWGPVFQLVRAGR